MIKSSDRGRNRNSIESWIDASSKRHKWCVVVVVMVAVLLAIVALTLCAKNIVVSDGAKLDKEEFFIALDYQDVALQNIHLPYIYEMKGVKNTLTVNLDKVESVYPQNNRLFVVVHGGGD